MKDSLKAIKALARSQVMNNTANNRANKVLARSQVINNRANKRAGVFAGDE